MRRMTLPLTTRPISEVADELGLAPGRVLPWGRNRAKIELGPPGSDAAKKHAGRLVLVSAINPTPAGEGKTTTSIGLAMALRRLGEKTVVCLREPSLGPVFGVKGGGTGGGKASLFPADAINLHFTGDIHAITSAHNLLSAMADNALHFGLTFGDRGKLDPRLVNWARALDMNDRALRNVVLGLGRKADGVPRQERFDITAASEIMAILALAKDQADLSARLSRVVVGQSESGAPITAGDLGASEAMSALLIDALMPNLVQTLEGGPALVHAGPFANIAHGCSSVVSTRLGIESADWAVTEAGFGFDLGGEKFLDIKCREAGVWPRVIVLVATLRALKVHGGSPVKTAKEPNQHRLDAGLTHLDKHLETIAALGLKAVVAINRFPDDVESELQSVQKACEKHGVQAFVSEAFAKGGEGALDLARGVIEAGRATDAAPPAPRYAYETSDPVKTKILKIAKTFYGASGIALTPRAEKDLERVEKAAPPYVCMAKTQYSLSDDPVLVGRPHDFGVTVREIRLSAGAGFAVAVTGEMMTMPGLPREPAAIAVRVDPDGRIRGLMQND
jgi:formate--tetrahydrofolate ligase